MRQRLDSFQPLTELFGVQVANMAIDRRREVRRVKVDIKQFEVVATQAQKLSSIGPYTCENDTPNVWRQRGVWT